MTELMTPNAKDTRPLRDAFGCFVSGITLVTARSDSGPVGFVANSFSSLSLDPPLIMWALSNHARRRPYFEAANNFSVHILGADQHSICEAFATRKDAFDPESTSFNDKGVPVLDKCLARFDCRKFAAYPGGDHQIILGQVDAFVHHVGPGLGYHQGNFFTADSKNR